MNRIGKAVANVGKKVAWLNVVLVLLVCTDVLLRYSFQISKAWVTELEWHLFALIFLAGGGWALLEEKHVRVDVFYQSFSTNWQRRIDLFGHLFFAIPWCVMIIYTAWQYAWQAWKIGEGSPDPGGLPARFLIKFAIVLGFGLLLMAVVNKVLQLLFHKNEQGT